jgi:hypothetical protein
MISSADTPRRGSALWAAAAAAALLATAAPGCAADHGAWVGPEARARVPALRRVGLVAPRVIALEEDWVGAIEVDASHVVKALGDAFVAQLAADGTSVVRIAVDDPDAIAAGDRFALFDGLDGPGRGRPVPRGNAPVDPTTGRIAGLGGAAVPNLVARYGVDAIWLVEGETVRSARVRGDLAVVFTVPFGIVDIGVSWQAAHASLRAALVDVSGAVLFYCALDEDHLPPEGTPTDGDDGSPRGADLQDPFVAWAYAATAVRSWRDAVR